MGAPDYKARFKDAQTLLSYGFNVSDLYLDENTDALEDLRIEGGVEDTVPVRYQSEFRYLDTEGNSLDGVKKTIELPEEAQAPVAKGAEAGRAVYLLNGWRSEAFRSCMKMMWRKRYTRTTSLK